MIKKSLIRRMTTYTIALIIVSILYFFPSTNQFTPISSVDYIDINRIPIYLINKEEYLIRTTIAIKETDPLERSKELISALTINSNKKDYIPSNFSPIIPENTRILSISLENNLLKINFSKEILNVPKSQEKEMIEAIIYTLTEIEDIKEIMIFIENNKLDILPQSKIILPNTLTRDFGINKIYDITDFKDATKTTVYYIGKEDDLVYYIPITKISNSDKNKVEIIIEELKSSPIYETNLISYLASSVELLNYETLENQISLSFNNEILGGLNSKEIEEEVKYSIALSLIDSLNVDDVIFKVDDNIITSYKSAS